MKLHRWLLEIKWHDHVRNKDIKKHQGIEEKNSCTIKKRQLKCFDHVARINQKRWTKQLSQNRLRDMREYHKDAKFL